MKNCVWRSQRITYVRQVIHHSEQPLCVCGCSIILAAGAAALYSVGLLPDRSVKKKKQTWDVIVASKKRNENIKNNWSNH